MAHEADELFAGPALAGHPDVPGHPGANWLMFAPWASNSVGGVITGDTTGPLGFSTGGIQQAAADGNQWIFNDIGGRFSAFLEMYEQNPVPTEAELESFFANSFDEGDGTIRTGFAAYVAAMEEDDPVRRQRLMFQGNTLVATHEQAGAQPYLEDVSLGPDNIAVRFVDARVGSDVLDMDQDIPARPGVNNHVIAAPLLSMDTGGRTADSFVGGDTLFVTGGDSNDGVVDLAPMAGIEALPPRVLAVDDGVVRGGGRRRDRPGEPGRLRRVELARLGGADERHSPAVRAVPHRSGAVRHRPDIGFARQCRMAARGRPARWLAPLSAGRGSSSSSP